MTIKQTPYILGIVVYDSDGTTKLYDDISHLQQGLTPPDFPEVGNSAEFVIDGSTIKTEITSKKFNYQIGGNAITTSIFIAATKD